MSIIKSGDYFIYGDDAHQLYSSTHDLPYYNHMDIQDKVVLDVGACFGLYSKYAAEHGAKKVIAIEPDHDNFELLKMNCGHLHNIVMMEGAATTRKVAELELYSCGSRTMHTSYSVRGRKSTSVDAIDWEGLLYVYEPEIIKMDAEGAEFELLEVVLPDFVREVSIEFHYSVRTAIKANFAKIVEQFDSWDLVGPFIRLEDTKTWLQMARWKR